MADIILPVSVVLVFIIYNYFLPKFYLGETSTEPNEQRRKVSQVHIHPQFNPSMLDNDFSLLELESEIEVTDYVGSVCLPEDANEEFGAGTLAVATGWGREASIEDKAGHTS